MGECRHLQKYVKRTANGMVVDWCCLCGSIRFEDFKSSHKAFEPTPMGAWESPLDGAAVSSDRVNAWFASLFVLSIMAVFWTVMCRAVPWYWVIAPGPVLMATQTVFEKLRKTVK